MKETGIQSPATHPKTPMGDHRDGSHRTGKAAIIPGGEGKAKKRFGNHPVEEKAKIKRSNMS